MVSVFTAEGRFDIKILPRFSQQLPEESVFFLILFRAQGVNLIYQFFYAESLQKNLSVFNVAIKLAGKHLFPFRHVSSSPLRIFWHHCSTFPRRKEVPFVALLDLFFRTAISIEKKLCRPFKAIDKTIFI